MRSRIITLLITISFLSLAQGGPLKKIKKAILKANFEKAEQVIIKSIEKDSLNAGVWYFYSVLFTDTAFTRYQIDSARISINNAINYYQVSDEERIKKLSKVGLDAKVFETQKAYVSKLGFQRALDRMSVQAFDLFLINFPEAHQAHKATLFRDSLAFNNATRQNTWQVYKSYFETYPESGYAPKARELYQLLIFRDYTKSDNLEDYIRFLDEHPETPFRKEAEEVVLQRMATDNLWSSYLKFLQRYPKSHLRKKIGDILYYLTKSNSEYSISDVISLHSHADSLSQVHNLEGEILIPIAEEDLFGFMNLDGEIPLPPQYTQVDPDYLCGNISSEWLRVKNGKTWVAISRNGKEIIPVADQLKEIGPSCMLASGPGPTLYHKSGFQILSIPIEGAHELPNGWIAFKSKEGWGISTCLGRILVDPGYDSISVTGHFIILEQAGTYLVASNKQKVKHKLAISHLTFDDYEVINNSLLLGYQEDKECLLDANLNTLIPLEGHKVYVSSGFIYRKSATGYQIFDQETKKLGAQSFDHLEVNDGWAALDSAGTWTLISRRVNDLMLNNLDSVKILSDHTALCKYSDTVAVIFQNGTRQVLNEDENVQWYGAGDKEYLTISSKRSQSTYSNSGTPLFKSQYESVWLLSDTLFLFKSKGKVGVINHNGQVLLPAGYDAIEKNGPLLFLLKGKKIGAYDLENDIKIPTNYDGKIDRIGPFYQVTFRGEIGLTDKEGRAVLSTDFDEFVLWNDTSLWALNNKKWSLLTINEQVIKEEVLSFEPIVTNDRDSYYLVLEKDGLGLLSKKKGIILPSEYNEIINLGTSERPVFIAEQHLKAASIYVVTYFDGDGKVLKSQAFRPDQYEKMYCENPIK